jgi:tRNA G18 (ribose-2'-O)-methylase SpoU
VGGTMRGGIDPGSVWAAAGSTATPLSTMATIVVTPANFRNEDCRVGDNALRFAVRINEGVTSWFEVPSRNAAREVRLREKVRTHESYARRLPWRWRVGNTRETLGQVAPHVETIRDPDDARLDLFRNLKDAQQRTVGRFIVESERVLHRSVELGLELVAVVVTEERWRRIKSLLSGHSVDVLVVEPDVMTAVLGFALHRGVIALASRTALRDPSDVLGRAERVVVLEDVVDPDNVGSMFRHAAAFGADGVLLSEHCGDPLYRKAVRASMGWVLDVPWTRLVGSDELVSTLRTSGFTTLAFTPSGDVDLLDDRLRTIANRPIAVLLGAESDGLRSATMAACDYRVSIPIAAHVDSLNVATAAAIAMFTLFRKN